MFNTIPEVISAIANGEMIILLDDETRENEGDLVMAAEHVTPEAINFMTQQGRGLICMPMTQSRCEQLGLPLMVANGGGGRFDTQFTISIEAKTGVSTGISAQDRATTIQAACAPNATAEDITSPGHIFPIMAKPGGVLKRAGHTEASCDLARLAGLQPTATIVEILNEDGTMARQPELLEMAKAWNLKIATIADLIRYRTEHEKTLEQIERTDINTQYGPFTLIRYLDALDGLEHMVFQKGSIHPDQPTLVRVHYEDYLSDIVHLKSHRRRWSWDNAMRYIAQHENGILIRLSNPTDLSTEMTRLKKISQASPAQKQKFRTIGTGARILHDLGIRQLRVLGPQKTFLGLSGFDLDVVEYVDEESVCHEK